MPQYFQVSTLKRLLSHIHFTKPYFHFDLDIDEFVPGGLDEDGRVKPIVTAAVHFDAQSVCFLNVKLVSLQSPDVTTMVIGTHSPCESPVCPSFV